MSEEEFVSLRDEIMWLTYGGGYNYILENTEIYDGLLVCSDRDFWGADLDMDKVRVQSEYLIHIMNKAQSLADSAWTEQNVRLIKVHVLYNAVCAWYEDFKINGTDEEREYYDSLISELRDILVGSGATYISFWRTVLMVGALTIPEIDWETDPYTWINIR